MGLTINYTLQLDSASVDVAREKVVALRNFAQKLPFAKLEELVELEGKACIFDEEDFEDDYIFLKIRALKPVNVSLTTVSAVEPTCMIGFDTLPGKGCETAAFGLATHAEITGTNDWLWHGFCKTQYASNPEYGGVSNFLKCHLMIVKMLDEAQKLGISCDVRDESHYWETRDIEALAQTIHAQNILVAALTGQLRDNFQDSEAKNIISPIFEYPNFEYLEAEGNRA